MLRSRSSRTGGSGLVLSSIPLSIRCLLLLTVSLTAIPASTAHAQVTTLGTFALERGEEVFWSGPTAIEMRAGEAAVTFDPEVDCAQVTRECFEYVIETANHAPRLRVALDTPDGFDGFTEFLDNGELLYIALYNPTGEFVTKLGRYSMEVAVSDPAPGAWRVRVVPLIASNATFRMRAKLESHVPRAHPTKLLLPNLRMTPPFEFTFATPVVPFVGSGPAGGLPSGGCLADEIATHRVKRCLRFSYGPENIGGPLDLRFGRAGHSTPTGGTVFQRIYAADGTFEEREAGTYKFHATHAHYHWAGYGETNVLRVVDPENGVLEPAGTGPKQGGCPSDHLIVDWTSFSNDPGPNETSTCQFVGQLPTAEAMMTITPGWADVYSYAFQGNFAGFDDNPDGLYVIQVRANLGDSIHETTTSDNYSYAYIEVVGDSVRVVERGYGESPWDPKKQVVDDTRLATAEE